VIRKASIDLIYIWTRPGYAFDDACTALLNFREMAVILTTICAVSIYTPKEIAVFDHSRPFPAGSKWRQKLSSAERARIEATDKRMRIEIQTGVALPAPPRRSKARPTPVSDAEMAELRAFLGEHGRAIAHMLARARNEPQRVALVRAYRDVVNGVAGAYERWGRLSAELGT